MFCGATTERVSARVCCKLHEPTNPCGPRPLRHPPIAFCETPAAIRHPHATDWSRRPLSPAISLDPHDTLHLPRKNDARRYADYHTSPRLPRKTHAPRLPTATRMPVHDASTCHHSQLPPRETARHDPRDTWTANANSTAITNTVQPPDPHLKARILRYALGKNSFPFVSGFFSFCI